MSVMFLIPIIPRNPNDDDERMTMGQKSIRGVGKWVNYIYQEYRRTAIEAIGNCPVSQRPPKQKVTVFNYVGNETQVRGTHPM